MELKNMTSPHTGGGNPGVLLFKWNEEQLLPTLVGVILARFNRCRKSYTSPHTGGGNPVPVTE